MNRYVSHSTISGYLLVVNVQYILILSVQSWMEFALEMRQRLGESQVGLLKWYIYVNLHAWI